MTRFSLVVLFSMACPAALLAQTALQMKKPPMPGTTTTGTKSTTSNTNTSKTSSATTSVAQPLLNTKRNTLDMQSRSIQQGMSEASERQDQAMSAANATTKKKINANNQQINVNLLQADEAHEAKKASADRLNQARSTVQKTLDMQRQMRPCPTC
jgi:hypothetical protein